MKPAIALLLLTMAAALLVSQPASREVPGPLPGGATLLVSGWKVQPAGRQIPLSTLPMSTALTPDGKHLLILNGGYNPPTIAVFEARSMRELSRVRLADGWLGLAIAPNGQRVYVGGGSRAAVFEFSLSTEGALEPMRTFEAVEGGKTYRDFIGDVVVSPDGRLVYAADLFHDRVLIFNPQSGRVIERIPTGRRPYRILFHPDGKSFFVSSWADAAVHHHQAETGKPLGQIPVGAHASDMVFRDAKTLTEEEDEEPPYKARLFVASANTNRVYVVGLSESKDMRLVETISVAMTPNQPAGMTPSALALNADRSTLYVVCSDANAVAVADVSRQRTRVKGFVPTGWYPTAARALADGRLIVLNGRGLRSYPNPQGPGPMKRVLRSHEGIRTDQYVAALQMGSASLIDAFDDEALAGYTRTVMANSPYRDLVLREVNTGPGNPVPGRTGDKTPIEHVIYVVKENRTYDQVLGGLEKGNGDKSLVIFDEQSAPNHYKLAREFVLFDNFYVNADVSADGHNWTAAAIAPDYVQKLWPNSYAGRRRHYDYEGGEPAALPPAGYIWNNVLAAGLTMRNYGAWVTNKPKTDEAEQIQTVRDPALARVTNLRYRGFDLNYKDVDRMKVFLEDLAEFERTGQMPRFIYLRLGNDHTSGTAPGKYAPLAAMADNDYALGLMIEALSKSKFWPNLAVFVLEDDAQNGADHVDSHRSPAYVVSPYTRRSIVDSTFYNTTSMLRTMELILGLRPMTHFDAAARPMSAAFATTPNLTPYIAEKPRHSIDERNPPNTPTAARSMRMDFSEEDRIDDDELNAILWLAVRGTEPPTPVRSYFGR